MANFRFVLASSLTVFGMLGALIAEAQSSGAFARTTILSGDYSHLPEQSASGPLFGTSIAMDGAWLAVGAPGTITTGDGLKKGLVFLYQYQESGGSAEWQLAQRIMLPAAVDEETECGFSVDLKLPNLIIGCPGAFSNPNFPERGFIYFFRLNQSGVWNEVHTDIPGGPNSRCGSTVSLSATGASGSAVAAISCENWEEVQVYFYSGVDGAWGWSNWVQPGDVSSGARFGQSIAIRRIEAEGVAAYRMAVGEPARQHGNSILAGSVYLFSATELDPGGPPGSWTETHEFTHPSPESFGATWFGWSLDLNASQLVIGAPGGYTFECPNAPRCGTVHRYEREGADWVSRTGGGAINAGGNPPGEQPDMHYGRAVALGFDNWIAVAAPRADGWNTNDGLAEESGMVELRRGSSGNWGSSWGDTQGEVRPLLGSLERNNGHFGTDVAFSEQHLAVGYPRWGSLFGSGRQGAVWIYEIADTLFADRFEE